MFLLCCVGATILGATYLLYYGLHADVPIRDTQEAVEQQNGPDCACEPLTPQKSIVAHVTAFNTVPQQTDSTPCIAASGDNICGRDDVVACPREIPLYTAVRILGKVYVCLDRTNTRIDGRYDISFDKDIQAALLFGIQELTVDIYEQPIQEVTAGHECSNVCKDS